MEIARHWRLRKQRLTGRDELPCCGVEVARKTNFRRDACPRCGTRQITTEDGATQTMFGQGYLQMREEKVRRQTGGHDQPIAVELAVRKIPELIQSE